VTLKMPAFEWVHVQLHQQKGMISLSPPTICNSALENTIKGVTVNLAVGIATMTSFMTGKTFNQTDKVIIAIIAVW
ncbi:hypothetical protein ACRWV0_24200, partial [Escherichia coli]